LAIIGEMKMTELDKRELVEKRKDQGRLLFNPAMILAEKRGKRYPKKHGAIMVFKDELIEVRYDTYAPNLSVYLNGQIVLDFQLGEIKSYIPAFWVDHLKALAAPILLEEEWRKLEEEKQSEAEYLAKWGITE
jgi:hypothetical protein